LINILRRPIANSDKKRPSCMYCIQYFGADEVLNKHAGYVNTSIS